MTTIYNKILLYQYGKVGSTSLKESNFGMYYDKIQVAYPCHMIQVHDHKIVRDIIIKEGKKKGTLTTSEIEELEDKLDALQAEE